MKKNTIAQLVACGVSAAALAGAMLLGGCSGSSTTTGTDSGATETAEATVDGTAFQGTWVYNVETTVASVYGDVSKEVEAFSLELAEDGTATVTPGDEVDGYSEDSGTWTATSETEATVTLDGAGEFTVTLEDEETMSAPAGTFNADDTEAYELDLD